MYNLTTGRSRRFTVDASEFADMFSLAQTEGGGEYLQNTNNLEIHTFLVSCQNKYHIRLVEGPTSYDLEDPTSTFVVAVTFL